MSLAKDHVRTSRDRWRDMGLYTVISSSLLGALCYAILVGVRIDLFMRWFGVIFSTLTIFGYIVSSSRSFWRSHVFWLMIGTLLIVHVSVFTHLAIRGMSISGYKWMLIAWIEFILLGIGKALLNWRCKESHSSHGT